MILNTERFQFLQAKHAPNTPRTHDHHGHKVDEPVQCRKCLQTWPCDVKNLLDYIEELQK